jgi:hypothetical protein
MTHKLHISLLNGEKLEVETASGVGIDHERFYFSPSDFEEVAISLNRIKELVIKPISGPNSPTGQENHQH